MQTVRVLTLALIIALMALSCGQKIDQNLTEAPFFTSLEEGMKAASVGKSIVVDFYTDW